MYEIIFSGNTWWPLLIVFFSTYLETKWQKHDANKNQNLLSTSYGKFNIFFSVAIEYSFQ